MSTPSDTPSDPSRDSSMANRTKRRATKDRVVYDENYDYGLEEEDQDASSVRNPAPFVTPATLPRPLSPLHKRPREASPTPSPEPDSPQSNYNGFRNPNLLSSEQKKANHIASEQKRRAAIRMGYEGLCEVVPSLRIAVEEFETRVKLAKSRPVSIQNSSKNGVLMGGIEVGGEKIDGRAGPKSEAVVLSKSVEYLRELLVDRERLLTQLTRAYAELERRQIAIPPTRYIWDERWSQSDNSANAEPFETSKDDDKTNFRSEISKTEEEYNVKPVNTPETTVPNIGDGGSSVA